MTSAKVLRRSQSRCSSLELARFDLGKVQNVVDHLEQHGAAVADGLRIAVLFGIELRLQ